MITTMARWTYRWKGMIVKIDQTMAIPIHIRSMTESTAEDGLYHSLPVCGPCILCAWSVEPYTKYSVCYLSPIVRTVCTCMQSSIGWPQLLHHESIIIVVRSSNSNGQLFTGRSEPYISKWHRIWIDTFHTASTHGLYVKDLIAEQN